MTILQKNSSKINKSKLGSNYKMSLISGDTKVLTGEKILTYALLYTQNYFRDAVSTPPSIMSNKIIIN
jgi:hypothetical protein